MSGKLGATIELLAGLVAFDTTSHKTNIPLIEYVEAYLRRFDVQTQRVTNETGDKASLFATIGPQDTPGIALSGHTDVVPVLGQDWDTDPFRLVERGDRLYGRGTTDMKGFLACVLAAVPDLKQRPLKTPVHIVFSYDEEIGCVGVRPLIAELGDRFPIPRAVVVGEPTLMTVVDAHKGPIRWEVEVIGRAAHSSMAPLGVNAIQYAARIVSELGRIETGLMQAPRDTRFNPPYATMQMTSIEGGTAGNIVPVSCRFGFDLRAMPGLDVGAIESRIARFIDEECLPEMRRIAPESDIRMTTANRVPPFAAQPGSQAVALALRLAQANETFAASYATEAGLFQDADAPSVVCGPGDIAQAHTANEWIELNQLEACNRFLTRLSDSIAN